MKKGEGGGRRGKEEINGSIFEGVLSINVLSSDDETVFLSVVLVCKRVLKTRNIYSYYALGTILMIDLERY